MMAAERPEWMNVQKRTFTNWINLQLSKRDLKVEDLETDICDGVRLINLVEILSGKSVGPYKQFGSVSSGTATTKNRQLRMHFAHNIEKALRLLQDQEEVKIVNIGAKDIVDQNTQAIFGLVWTLILKYHFANGVNDRSAKKELLEWVRSRIGPSTRYGLDIKNFTTDFQDGKALLALCDACAPGSQTDWASESSTPEERAKRAMKSAKSKTKVPDILAAGDLGDDLFSTMAYLEYFKDLAPPLPDTPEMPRRTLGEGDRGSSSVQLTAR